MFLGEKYCIYSFNNSSKTQVSKKNSLKKYFFLTKMYFDSNQINSKLICKKCEGRLDEPRLLPCGKNICSYCIACIKVLNKEFQC